MIFSVLSALAASEPIKTRPVIKSTQIALGHVLDSAQLPHALLPTVVAIFTTITPLLEDLSGLVLLPGTDCGVALPRPADPEPRDTDALALTVM